MLSRKNEEAVKIHYENAQVRYFCGKKQQKLITLPYLTSQSTTLTAKKIYEEVVVKENILHLIMFVCSLF